MTGKRRPPSRLGKAAPLKYRGHAVCNQFWQSAHCSNTRTLLQVTLPPGRGMIGALPNESAVCQSLFIHIHGVCSIKFPPRLVVHLEEMLSSSESPRLVTPEPSDPVAESGTASIRVTDYGTLIAPLQSSSTSNHSPTVDERELSESRSTITGSKYRNVATYVITLCIVSNLMVEIGDFLIRAPFMRILESILCRQYWQQHDRTRFPTGEIDEERCKIGSIQADLAMLKGWDLLFSCLPTMLMTIPMGIVADRYGRKRLMFISLLGLTMATTWMQIVVCFYDMFDLKWFWAGNAFLLIGGGPAVINNMFFIVLADVTSEEERAPTSFRFLATNFWDRYLEFRLLGGLQSPTSIYRCYWV
jgi:hypothetical protein